MVPEQTKSTELIALQTELAEVEARYGRKLVSIFPGTNRDATKEEILRAAIESLRRVGEEIENGTLEVVEIDD